MALNIIKKHLTNGQYLTQQYPKLSQFIHHTAGISAYGAWAWWNQTPERVGTPYIIERNGDIWECFDPSMWAWHLGIVGDDNMWEKQSINIEIVCTGQVHLVEGKFLFFPLWPKTKPYHVIPKDDVFTLKEEWRGYKHFQKYTDEQIGALVELIRKNHMEFQTLGVQEDPTDWYKFNDHVYKNHLPGIWGHTTVRETGKWDPFPYPPFLKAMDDLFVELLEIQNPKKIKGKEQLLEAQQSKKTPPTTKSKSKKSSNS